MRSVVVVLPYEEGDFAVNEAEGGGREGEGSRAQLSNRKGEGCKSHSGILNLRDLFVVCDVRAVSDRH